MDGAGHRAETASSTPLIELHERALHGDRFALARLITQIEAGAQYLPHNRVKAAGHVVGVTGAPGAGKSSVINMLAAELVSSADLTVAVLAVDPSSHQTGGALLGDRIRMMQHVANPRIFIRSMASRGAYGGLAQAVPCAIDALLDSAFDNVLVETVGVGQNEVDVVSHVDTAVLVVTPEGGDDVQLSKAGAVERADLVVVNKADRPGSIEMVRRVQAMLTMRNSSTTTWSIPVLPVEATTGRGIEELAEALGRHREHLVASGEMAARRAAGQVTAFERATTAEVTQLVADALASSRGQALRQEVATGRRPPAAAAHELLRHMTDVVPRGWVRA